MPDPVVVESLDLPVIPAADRVVPPVSGTLCPTSKETTVGGDILEGAGLPSESSGGKAKESEVQAFLFSQGFLPPCSRKVGGEDTPS